MGATDPPDWSGLERAFAFIRAEAAPNEVIRAGLHTLFFLYTDRRAIRAFPHLNAALFYGEDGPAAGTPEQLIERMKRNGIRYLVSTPLYLFAEDAPFSALISELVARGDLKAVSRDENAGATIQILRLAPGR